MVIYLSHPVHGRKVATMELEAVEDEKNGWTRYNPDTPVEAAPVNMLEVAVNALETKRKYTRRTITEGV
jgi:hypothetical protein